MQVSQILFKIDKWKFDITLTFGKIISMLLVEAILNKIIIGDRWFCRASSEKAELNVD